MLVDIKMSFNDKNHQNLLYIFKKILHIRKLCLDTCILLIILAKGKEGRIFGLGQHILLAETTIIKEWEGGNL